MSTPVVPEGQSPPFAVVTPTDHSAWIIIATALGLSCVLLFSFIRVCVRLTIAPPFGLDDLFLGAATAVSFAQSSTILFAASLGLGKSVELVKPEHLVHVQKLYYVTSILFVIALGLSKCSIIGLLLRMTPMQNQVRVFRGSLVLLAAWTFAFTLAIALQCNLTQPWMLIGERCPGLLVRWQVFASFDIVTELALVVLALYLVWNLRLSTLNKAIVIIAFALRFPVLFAIGFRLYTFDEAGYTVNPTLLESVFIVWTQAELSFSIVAATLPTLRRFVSGLATYYGAFDQNKATDGSSHERRSDTGYALSPLTSAVKSADREGPRPLHSDKLPQSKRSSSFARAKQAAGYRVLSEPRQQSGGTTTNSALGPNLSRPPNFTGNEGSTATHVMAQDSNSMMSNDSQQMIIKKDVTWTVERGSEGAI